MAVLKEGRANLARGVENVGGKLFLEGRVLRFEPHGVNVQREPQVIHVADIKRLEPAWTKVLGIPLAPNGMRAEMRNGEVFLFTVSGRKAWIQAIADVHDDTSRR